MKNRKNNRSVTAQVSYPYTDLTTGLTMYGLWKGSGRKPTKTAKTPVSRETPSVDRPRYHRWGMGEPLATSENPNRKPDRIGTVFMLKDTLDRSRKPLAPIGKPNTSPTDLLAFGDWIGPRDIPDWHRFGHIDWSKVADSRETPKRDAKRDKHGKTLVRLKNGVRSVLVGDNWIPERDYNAGGGTRLETARGILKGLRVYLVNLNDAGFTDKHASLILKKTWGITCTIHKNQHNYLVKSTSMIDDAFGELLATLMQNLSGRKQQTHNQVTKWIHKSAKQASSNITKAIYKSAGSIVCPTPKLAKPWDRTNAKRTKVGKAWVWAEPGKLRTNPDRTKTAIRPTTRETTWIDPNPERKDNKGNPRKVRLRAGLAVHSFGTRSEEKDTLIGIRSRLCSEWATRSASVTPLDLAERRETRVREMFAINTAIDRLTERDANLVRAWMRGTRTTAGLTGPERKRQAAAVRRVFGEEAYA